jgi:hypothetical protein
LDNKKYWAPQLPMAGVATSQGHLELFASAGTSNGTIILPTFSTDAFNAMQQSAEYTTDPEGAVPLFPTANPLCCSISTASAARRHRGPTWRG